MDTIRAVYEDGHLRLLEPVHLAEGQEIEVMILTDRERVRRALGDMVADIPESPEDEDFDEDALMREIEEGTRGVTLSDIIIEERREGP